MCKYDFPTLPTTTTLLSSAFHLLFHYPTPPSSFPSHRPSQQPLLPKEPSTNSFLFCKREGSSPFLFLHHHVKNAMSQFFHQVFVPDLLLSVCSPTHMLQVPIRILPSISKWAVTHITISVSCLAWLLPISRYARTSHKGGILVHSHQPQAPGRQKEWEWGKGGISTVPMSAERQRPWVRQH